MEIIRVQAGGCRCGAVRYSLAGDPPPVIYACHCKYCQTWSGSAFALHALAPLSSLQLSGALEHHEDIGLDGAAGTRRSFCAVCRTRIVNAPAAMGGWIVLSAGTLDDSADLTPSLHMWTSRKQRWLALPRDAAEFPTTPSPEAFFAAAAGRR